MSRASQRGLMLAPSPVALDMPGKSPGGDAEPRPIRPKIHLSLGTGPIVPPGTSVARIWVRRRLFIPRLTWFAQLTTRLTTAPWFHAMWVTVGRYHSKASLESVQAGETCCGAEIPSRARCWTTAGRIWVSSTIRAVGGVWRNSESMLCPSASGSPPSQAGCKGRC